MASIGHTNLQHLYDPDDDMFELSDARNDDKSTHQTQDDCLNFAHSPLPNSPKDVMARSCSLKGLINIRETMQHAGNDNKKST